MGIRLPANERREAIVAAAIRLFAQRGFRGATTKELARAVGVSEPILYQHFRAKSDLYRAIIETKTAEGQDLVDRTLKPFLSGSDDRGFLTALARLTFERFDQDPDFIRLLLFSALEGHELGALFYERQHVCFFRLISGYIRRRMEEGGFRPTDPDIAARAFLGMLNHHGLAGVLFHDRLVEAGREQIVAEMVRTFLFGISSNMQAGGRISRRKPRPISKGLALAVRRAR